MCVFAALTPQLVVLASELVVLSAWSRVLARDRFAAGPDQSSRMMGMMRGRRLAFFWRKRLRSPRILSFMTP